MSEQGKLSTMAVEDVGAEKARIEHSHMVKPDGLIGLSEGELASVGRKATLKLDCFIMPCVTVLYILNYLDRQVQALPPSDLQSIDSLTLQYCRTLQVPNWPILTKTSTCRPSIIRLVSVFCSVGTF